MEWTSHLAYFNVSLLPLMEAWQWSVAASNRQRLRGRAEHATHNAPVGVVQESDSSSQLVGSAPQQVWRTSEVGERTEVRPVACAGAAHLHLETAKDSVHYGWQRGVCPLPPQTGEHQTLTDTPL